MKKLSTGMIIAIVLMLLSVTAVAVGLTVEDIWRQSFEKMGTTGLIRDISDAAEAEISMDEAIAIAKQAIMAKYGTPEAELDAMGVYPTYAARGWDGKTDEYPSEWDIYFSSRTGVDIQMDDENHGPTGEYRVYINAETKEVTYCHWYTNDFWARAQTVWDCGSYDEIDWWYGRPEFFALPQETQAYWTNLLAEKGYTVIQEDEKLHHMLAAAELELQFCEVSQIADNADPLVAAAWQALEEQLGLDADLLRKYCYVPTVPAWETSYDNVCIHYCYSLQFEDLNNGFLDHFSNHLFNYADNFGLYMVSFEKGTTNVAAITHVLRSETINQPPVTTGGLIARTDWTGADLVPFDTAFTQLDRAIKRMRAAMLTNEEIEVVVDDFMHGLGGNPEWYPAAPAQANAAQWFQADSEWDAHIKQPSMTRMEVQEQYGWDSRYWPLEVQYEFAYDGSGKSLPREGEMTQEEAIARALKAVTDKHGPEALEALGDYAIGCVFTRHQNDGEFTMWWIYITDDPEFSLNGYRVVITRRDGEDWGEDDVYDIGDDSNG